jgi:hypothetical protein
MQRALAALLIAVAAADLTVAESAEIKDIVRVTSEAERRTGIPVAVPRELPLLEESELLYAISTSGAASEYEINLGFAPGCNGGTYCSYGDLAGKRADSGMIGTANFAYDLSAAKTFDLTDSVKGYFIDSECGAFCDDAKVFWIQNGYLYMVGMKGGSESDVIRMARSAIDNVAPPNTSLERARN